MGRRTLSSTLAILTSGMALAAAPRGGIAAGRRPRRPDDVHQVRVLIALIDNPASSCMDARDLAASHLDAVRTKMRELKALERSLVSFVHACDTSCAGGPGPDCVILGDLGKGCGCEPHAS